MDPINIEGNCITSLCCNCCTRIALANKARSRLNYNGPPTKHTVVTPTDTDQHSTRVTSPPAKHFGCHILGCHTNLDQQSALVQQKNQHLWASSIFTEAFNFCAQTSAHSSLTVEKYQAIPTYLRNSPGEDHLQFDMHGQKIWRLTGEIVR